MSLPAKAWVAGYGSLIVPIVPYELAYRPDGVRIVIAHHGGEGVRSVMIAPDPKATSRKSATPTGVALGPSTTQASDVLATIEEVDFAPHWTIVTRSYTCAWPRGSTLWSTPHEIPWAFELTLGAEEPDAMTYVQAPLSSAECPSLESLIARSMEVGGRDELEGVEGVGEWLDLRYAMEGISWIQRRYRMPLGADTVALVTSQAPEGATQAAFDAAGQVASSLAVRVRNEDSLPP